MRILVAGNANVDLIMVLSCLGPRSVQKFWSKTINCVSVARWETWL